MKNTKLTVFGFGNGLDKLDGLYKVLILKVRRVEKGNTAPDCSGNPFFLGLGVWCMAGKKDWNGKRG